VTAIDMNAATLTTIRARTNQCPHGHQDGAFLAGCERGDYGPAVRQAWLDAEDEAAAAMQGGAVCDANQRVADRVVELVRAAENAAEDAAESVPA
jgi:hypothetical protein